MALLVPPPVLTQESVTGTNFGFNKPIELRSTGITFPDGRPLVMDNTLAAGFLLYRETAQGAVTAWREEDPRSWIAPIPGPEPQPLLYHENVWKSILVAIGEQDAQKNDKFDPQANPRYYVRTFFAGKDVHGARHEGESPPSNFFQLDTAAQPPPNELAGIVIDPPDLQKATTLRAFLKHKTLPERTELTLQSTAAGVTATLSHTSGTVTTTTRSIVLDATGVRVTGPLYVNGTFIPI
jgi:hypothetical protein